MKVSEEDINYKLYKLVFNNIYLSTYIFNNVVSNNTDKFHHRYRKYHEMDFEFMVNKKYNELIKDKIKAGIQFEGFTFANLKKFIYNRKEYHDNDPYKEYQFLNSFYQLNKKSLKDNTKTKFIHIDTNYTDVGLFGFTIYCQNFNFLKIVYKDLIGDGGEEGSLPSSSTTTTTTTTITTTTTKTKTIVTKQHQEQFNNMICTMFNLNSGFKTTLLDVALKYGDMEIIKYLYFEIGLKEYDQNKALTYSLCSVNRNEVVKFILNGDLKYDPIMDCQDINYDFNRNLMQLDISLLHRLYSLGTIIECKKVTLLHFDQSFYYMLKSGWGNSNRVLKKYIVYNLNSLISFLKNILFILYVSEENIYYLCLLKKLNFIISYNYDQSTIEKQNNDSDYFYTLNQKDIFKIVKREDLQKPKKQPNIFLNYLFGKKEISTTTTTTTTKPNGVMDIPDEIINFKEILKYGAAFTPINYENFNLQREIERIYIFDFLKYTIKLNLLEKGSYSELSSAFNSNYKEYVSKERNIVYLKPINKSV